MEQMRKPGKFWPSVLPMMLQRSRFYLCPQNFIALLSSQVGSQSLIIRNDFPEDEIKAAWESNKKINVLNYCRVCENDISTYL